MVVLAYSTVQPNAVVIKLLNTSMSFRTVFRPQALVDPCRGAQPVEIWQLAHVLRAESLHQLFHAR